MVFDCSRRTHRAELVIVASLVAACSSASPTTPEPVTPSPSVATAADLAFCVSETNRYRAMVGRSPLAQSSALEAYAAEGARMDAQTGVAHSHYNSTTRDIARAENESVLNFVAGDSVRAGMARAVLRYWEEGPTGPHYQNLTGPFTTLGCGVAVQTQTTLVFVQDFR
jgi:uncharacterized protein YkwD